MDRNNYNADGLLQYIVLDRKGNSSLELYNFNIMLSMRGRRGKFTFTYPFAAIIIASSISNGEITSPPLLMISFERPVMKRYLYGHQNEFSNGIERVKKIHPSESM